MTSGAISFPAAKTFFEEYRMRTIPNVIAQILALLPVPVHPELADDLTVFQAELAVILRTAAYTPPESPTRQELWARLATACYRYLPNPTAYAFARAISILLVGTAK